MRDTSNKVEIMLKTKFAILYYVLISIFLLVLAVYIPFQQAEKASVVYMNSRLAELKEIKKPSNLNMSGLEVNKILDAGVLVEKDEYKYYSARLGLIACIVVLGFILVFPYSRLSDVFWVGGFFSTLYALGSMTTEYYFLVVILALGTYYLKRKRNKL